MLEDSIMLHVNIYNAASPQTIESESWAIQIKTNPFGICAKNSTALKIPNLHPGEQHGINLVFFLWSIVFRRPLSDMFSNLFFFFICRDEYTTFIKCSQLQKR
jgi:hypothetical protein